MKEQIKHRTKKIGLEVIQLLDELPNKPSACAIGKQIVRRATLLGLIIGLLEEQSQKQILLTI